MRLRGDDLASSMMVEPYRKGGQYDVGAIRRTRHRCSFAGLCGDEIRSKTTSASARRQRRLGSLQQENRHGDGSTASGSARLAVVLAITTLAEALAGENRARSDRFFLAGHQVAAAHSSSSCRPPTQSAGSRADRIPPTRQTAAEPSGDRSRMQRLLISPVHSPTRRSADPARRSPRLLRLI